MDEYHKIQTVFKRDPATKYKTLLPGEFSIPEFEYLRHNNWVFTEKVDGTNIRLMWDGNQYQIGGKSDNAQIPAPLVAWIRENVGAEMFHSAFGTDGDVCLYGEGYGGKIQKAGNTYGPQQRFVLFDVKVGEWWLQREDVEDVANKMALGVVPVIGQGTLNDLVSLVKEGFNSVWGDFMAEGVVARPTTELKTRRGDRMITKLKHKDYLAP